MKEFKKARLKLVESLRRELIGPAKDDPDGRRFEELDVSPLQVYGAGILFPRKQLQECLEGGAEADDSEDFVPPEDDEIEDAEDVDLKVDDGGKRNPGVTAPDSQIEDQPLNLANEFSPSAVGITFRLTGSELLNVDVSFGTYEAIPTSKPHPRAGQNRADGTPYPEVREFILYRRLPRMESLRLQLDFSEKPSVVFPVPGTDDALRVHAMLRSSDAGESVISAMLVNHHQTAGTGAAAYRDCFFQAEMEIRDAAGRPVFTPIERPTGNSLPEELEALSLLYRHRRTFCLGHGCAGDWRRGEDVDSSGSTDRVSTATIPTYEVQPVQAREEPFSVERLDLSMLAFSDGAPADGADIRSAILEKLDQLCSDYEAWIQDQALQANILSSGAHREAAGRHLDACTRCLTRMKEGVALLGGTDRLPMMAFRIANRAMLMQQVHSKLNARPLDSEFPQIPVDYDEGPDIARRWRPFQLAFILMNIAGMTDQSHPDRELVDLIWFPTGGGKTEAYLGLAAYTIALRRLRDPANAGTTVLMRYTLRLLTAQQFQRASTLIMALDGLRRERYLGTELGDEPISIGLWVGQSLSPNDRSEARAALSRMRQRDSRVHNPFQVLHCPWCRCELKNRKKLGYLDERYGPGEPRTVVFRCPDASCAWSDGSTRMPIVVIDDDIYASPPTLVMGTVDKFAQVAWKDETGRIFGIDGKNGPPELIIQDELHLISGPLGSIVGLYEGVIERLCTSETSRPKIVASTATIRQANEQCKALYNRDTMEFPAQGLKAGDSYFAYENPGAPGRLYAGVFASGLKSHATAQVRTCSSLLQHAIPLPSESETVEDLSPTLDEGTFFPEADPYGTLVWYFNSLRELGSATTMCSGDIPEYIKSMCRRGDIPWDFRRRVRNYVELTSRRTADEIPEILEQLERPWLPKPNGPAPVDILLATNMISVGVDVSRLGLMVVTGQPKSTSEYIQATSRVGRQYPGLVVTVYSQSKSRDRSHYEQFVGYHQAYYRFVEATSITPFSPPARERGLRGMLMAISRLVVGLDDPSRISDSRDQIERELDGILDRISDVDANEEREAAEELRIALDEWEAVAPSEYGRMGGHVTTRTLAYPYGTIPDPVFQERSWPVLTSMRNVDGTAEAKVIASYDVPTAGDTTSTGDS